MSLGPPPDHIVISDLLTFYDMISLRAWLDPYEMTASCLNKPSILFFKALIGNKCGSLHKEPSIGTH